MELAEPTDMVIGNYVYEKCACEGAHRHGYKKIVFRRRGTRLGCDIEAFHQSQYTFSSHSVGFICTELLQDLEA